MTREQEKKAALYEILKNLVSHGYKCFTSKRGAWGFIITPSDNVLYIQPQYFGGYNFSLEYKPNRESGSGCQCLDEDVSTVTLETVKRAEREGIVFASKLNAPLYKNSAEWFEKDYSAQDLEEVSA